MAKNVRMNPMNSAATGISNLALRSMVRKLEQWEEMLVAITDHTSVISQFRLVEIKLVRDTLVIFQH